MNWWVAFWFLLGLNLGLLLGIGFIVWRLPRIFAKMSRQQLVDFAKRVERAKD